MTETFLDLVRTKAPPAIWSHGVKLAREGAVTLQERKKSEATLRVREKSRAVSPTVILYPDDEEWDCDCGGKAALCHHVVAAAIIHAQIESGTLEDAPEAEATDAPASAPPPKEPAAGIGYRLVVRHGALFLDRVITTPGASDQPFPMSLHDRIARGIRVPPIDPTHDDLAVDRYLAHKVRGDLPLAHLRGVFDALSRAADVTLADQPVKTNGEPVQPHALVKDGKANGIELVLELPRDLEILSLGVARVNGVLRPLSDTTKFGHRWEKLPFSRLFAERELGTLVTEVLPDLERTLEVTIRTHRLPTTVKRELPRVTFELSHELGALHVMPLVVYGDPPRARIDGGELVLLSPPAPKRDEARERTLVLRLRDELSLVPGRRVRFDGTEAARFSAKLERFISTEARTAASGEGARVRELVVRVGLVGDALDVNFELPPDPNASPRDAAGPPRRARLEDVADAYREGLGIVALEGGGFARLPADFLEKHGAAILDLVTAEKTDAGARKPPLPVLAEIAAELGCVLPDRLGRLANSIQNGASESAEPLVLPSDLRADLRPYQKEGVRFLGRLIDTELGGLLADDMGLGKTLQMIASLPPRKDGGKGRSLVVCPRSVMHNWAKEIARFRPDLKVAHYDGASRALDPDAHVTLMTYGLMRADIETIAKIHWDVAVLDEAQAIKNPDSQTTRAAYRLDASSKFALTGTPVENRLEDLWSLTRFAVPGLFGTRSDFQANYADRIERASHEASARLQKRIRPFLLRRKKKDVLPDLPPKTESLLYCELSESERAAYDTVRAATKKELVEKIASGSGVLAALEALLRLRQAACHTGLLPNREADTSAKVERLVHSLEELAAEGHRALVFSQWTSLLDKVEPHLDKCGITYNRLDGTTRDREAVVRAFQSEGGPTAMLVSLKAGGTGLNLTAADHVFLLDPWWNPAVEDQAIDRAHRIGQDRPVMIYRLVAKDTVEERILDLKEKKRGLSDVALAGAGPTGGLTRDDVLALLD